jgi:hypothetical protein
MYFEDTDGTDPQETRMGRSLVCTVSENSFVPHNRISCPLLARLIHSHFAVNFDYMLNILFAPTLFLKMSIQDRCVSIVYILFLRIVDDILLSFYRMSVVIEHSLIVIDAKQINLLVSL